MYQRMQAPCDTCKGKGKIMKDEDICKHCEGEGLLEVNEKEKVSIDVGTPDEHVLKFVGKGNEIPDAIAGDLYVKVHIKKHKVFTRKGADLFMEKQITLKQALCGFTFQVPFLDGKKLSVSSTKGEIVSPGSTMTINGKGMPFFKDTISTGNLFIKFSVKFPTSKQMTDETRTSLNNLLPGPKTAVAKPGTDTEYLDEFNESDLNPSAEGGRGHNQQEEEEGDPRY